MNKLLGLIFFVVSSESALSQVGKIDFPIILRQDSLIEKEKINTYKLDSCLIDHKFFYFLSNSEKPYLNKFINGDSISVSFDLEGLNWVIFEDKKLLIFNPYVDLIKRNNENNSENMIIDVSITVLPIFVVSKEGLILQSRSMDGTSYSNNTQNFIEYLSFMRKYRLVR